MRTIFALPARAFTAALLLTCLVAAGCRADGGTAAAEAEALPARAAPVILAAGDIASCDEDADEQTGRLVRQHSGTVLTLGDNVYGRVLNRELYRRCYEPAWGAVRERTRPVPGNHDYMSRDASGYFDYFGAAAGERGKGYYSFNVGTWHLVALNSNVPMHPGSAQERWLRADLGASPARCTLAYFHHPRFSSGPHGGTAAVRPLWDALHEAGVDVVLAGHDHIYERFAPQSPSGKRDPERGIRQFVVGTGGKSHYRIRRVARNSEVRNSDAFGVLSLTLGDSTYRWEFLPVADGGFRDAGQGQCH